MRPFVAQRLYLLLQRKQTNIVSKTYNYEKISFCSSIRYGSWNHRCICSKSHIYDE